MSVSSSVLDDSIYAQTIAMDEPSPFVVRAEQALRALKQNIVTHLDRESRLCRVYGEWHQTWLSHSEQIGQQLAELEARLAPWMQRAEPKLKVTTHD